MPNIIKHPSGLIEIIKTEQETEMERLKRENKEIKEKLDRILELLAKQ